MHADHSNHYNATLGHAHRLVHLRPAEHRLVGQLRPGTVEPQPAVVRRPRPADALRRRRRCGRRTSCPAATRGRASCPAPEPIAEHPRRASPAELQQLRTGRCSQALNRGHLAPRADDAAPGGPHPVVRDGLRHADRRPRRRSTCRRRPTRRSTLYGLKRGQHDGLRLAVPGRPPAGRARRALRRADRHRLVEQLGLARRHDRPRAAGARTSTSRSPACSRTSSGAGCSTTRWSSGRPSSAARRSTTRPTHKGREHHHWAFSLLAGRRRRQGRHRPRRDRRVRHHASPRTASTSTTSTPRSCTCWASTTTSSPTATPAATSA